MKLPTIGRLLAGSFVLLQAIDFCLTRLLLEGARPDVYEANPLAIRILHSQGWVGLALFKLLCTAVGLLAVDLLRRRQAAAARRVLLVMCLVMSSVNLYSGALLASPADKDAEDLTALKQESSGIDQQFDSLHQFAAARTQICEDLLAGRTDLDNALVAMRECLEEHSPRLLPYHRTNLPNVSRQDHVASYLFLKASALVSQQPDFQARLQELRETLQQRFPSIVLVDLQMLKLNHPLPWVAPARS